MALHDSTPLPKSASAGWALVNTAEWQATWPDRSGVLRQVVQPLKASDHFASAALDQLPGLVGTDFPPEARLYLASPDAILAPREYQPRAAELFQTLVDDTVPEQAIRCLPLSWPEDSCLVFPCPAGLPAVWKQAAPRGKVVPLAERDIRFLAQSPETDQLLVHVLPGYLQISIKQEDKLQLCNSFRYRETEETQLMCKSVLNHFFPERSPQITVLYSSKPQAETAAALAGELNASPASLPPSSFWEV